MPASARAAIESLSRLFGEMEGPAFVACPNPTVALHVRRRAGELGGGVFDVRFGALGRFASERSAARLGKSPLDRVVALEAARSALQDAPGPWTPWASEPHAAEELVRTIRQWDADALPEGLRALHSAYLERTRPFSTPQERCLAAAGEARDRPAEAPVLVAYALHGLDPAGEALLAAHDAAGKLRRIDLSPPAPVAAGLVVAPEPEDEARAAIRWVLERLRAGTPAYRIGLLYASGEPYDTLVAELLRAASVRFFGGARGSPGASRVGRTIAAATSWAASARDADALMAWLADSAAGDWKKNMPAAARSAGLFGSASAFVRRLEAMDRGAADPHFSALAALVSRIDASLELPAGDWTAAFTWLRKWIDGWLGKGDANALGALEALAMLAPALDRLCPRPKMADLARVVASGLSATVPGERRYGDGVYVGSVEEALGLEFDAAWVMGLTDGAFAMTPQPDPYWPGAPQEDRAAAARLAFGAACSAAPECVLSYPRGDRATGRESAPSPWIPSGLPVREVVSFDRMLREGPIASGHEYRLCHLLAGREDVVPELAPAFTAQRARRSSRLTEFDGLIGPCERAEWSPTVLETLAQCPMRYALQHEWKVTTEEPEAEEGGWRHSHRGQVVHGLLRDFLGARRGKPPSEGWSARERAELQALANDELDRQEAQGRVQPGADWDFARRQLLAALDAFLTDEENWRAESGAFLDDVECAVAGSLPFLTALDRTLTFTGRIDRVDRTPEGLVVFDYKTGQKAAAKAAFDPQRLQLRMYALAKGATRAAIWSLPPDGPPTREKEWVRKEDDDRQLAAWLEVLADLHRAGAFLARPGAEGDERHANCRYCPYDRICPTDRAEAWDRKSGDQRVHAYATAFEGGAE